MFDSGLDQTKLQGGNFWNSTVDGEPAIGYYPNENERFLLTRKQPFGFETFDSTLAKHQVSVWLPSTAMNIGAGLAVNGNNSYVQVIRVGLGLAGVVEWEVAGVIESVPVELLDGWNTITMTYDSITGHAYVHLNGVFVGMKWLATRAVGQYSNCSATGINRSSSRPMIGIKDYRIGYQIGGAL